MLMCPTSTFPCSSLCTMLLRVPVVLHVHWCMMLEAQLQNALLTFWWTPLMQIKMKTRRGGGQRRRTKSFLMRICINMMGAQTYLQCLCSFFYRCLIMVKWYWSILVVIDIKTTQITLIFLLTFWIHLKRSKKKKNKQTNKIVQSVQTQYIKNNFELAGNVESQQWELKLCSCDALFLRFWCSSLKKLKLLLCVCRLTFC